jgi:hypothetical protein
MVESRNYQPFFTKKFFHGKYCWYNTLEMLETRALYILSAIKLSKNLFLNFLSIIKINNGFKYIFNILKGKYYNVLYNNHSYTKHFYCKIQHIRLQDELRRINISIQGSPKFNVNLSPLISDINNLNIQESTLLYVLKSIIYIDYQFWLY